MHSSAVAATLVKSMLIFLNVPGQTNPVVKLLTNGGDWYTDTVRVHGSVSDQSITSAGIVALKVFNVLGQEVATLFAGEQSAGMHSTTFDGRSLAGGIYFIRLQAGQFCSTKKMLLMK